MSSHKNTGNKNAQIADEPCDKNLNIRVTQSELDDWQAKAVKRGLKRSEYVRKTMNRQK